MYIGDEFKDVLINMGVDIHNVAKMRTRNDKKKKLIITEITLVDGTKHEIINDYVWYAARKNKRW